MVIAVSVIIPVFNDRANLLNCLTALYDTAYQDFEVIVVDDNSLEDIALVAKDFLCKYIRLSQNQGPAQARNVGVAHSGGNILMFTDADCVVPKNWVKDYQENLLAENQKDPRVKALAGRLQSSPSLVERVHAYSLYGFVMNDDKRHTDFFNTSCAAIFRTTFDQLGGFANFMRVGEDQDLALRLVTRGEKIVYSSAITVFHHHGVMTLKAMFKKNFIYGRHIGLKLYKNHPVLFRHWYGLLSNPLIHFFLIVPLALMTTLRILKYNIFYDGKIIFYTPLIFINKLLFRSGIFLTAVRRE